MSSGMLDDHQAAADESSAAGLQMSPALLALNMDGLSYEEYFKKVDEMAELMRQHWRAEQRVKTLKVAIQLAKLLADTSQMKLYARKFKLITACLDEFGHLVHQRVHSIASGANKQQQQQQQQQPESSQLHYSSDMQAGDNAHELAKDICRNWFLKVASIRELVPRFYIELAILSSCDILFERMNSRALADSIEEQFYAQTLRRLTRSAWGFGDPIVALHARGYLCRLAERLIGWRGLTRESLLFELLFSNLKSGAQLIGQLDGSRLSLARSSHHNHRNQPHHHHHHHPQPQPEEQKPPASTSGAPTTTSSPVGQQDLLLYFELVSAPMQWILNLVTLRCDVYANEDERDFIENANKRLRRWAEELFDDEQEQRQQQQPADIAEGCCSAFRRNALLQCLLKALPGDIVAAMAQKFTDKLAEGQRVWLRQIAPPSNRSAVPTAAAATGREALLIIPTVYATLGSLLIALDASDAFEATASPELKRSILESAEGLLNELLECEHNRLGVAHLRCFKALVSYANHYQEERLDRLLERFLARLKRARQYVQHYAALLDTIKTLFSNRTRLHEFKRLFRSRPFCQLFDLLRKDEHKQEGARWILETMRASIKLNYKAEIVPNISDRLLMNFLLKVFETLNESLSPLAGHDDIRHLSQLVVFFVDRFELEPAAERLELYSRLRKCVSNLNLVLEHLVRRALELDLQHRKVERRRGARQNFLNGCLAYALVTTPALAEPPVRLELYQLACQQALDHMSLSLADYFMKQIVLTLSDSLEAGGSPASSLGKQQNKRPPAQQPQQQSNPTPVTQINKNDADQRQARQAADETSKSQTAARRRAPNALLANRLEAILCMLIEHQEHVDLKHKLALAQLLRECPIFDRHAELSQMSGRLTGPAGQFELNDGFNNNAQASGDGTPLHHQHPQSLCPSPPPPK